MSKKYQSPQRRGLTLSQKGKLIIGVPLAVQIVLIVCLMGLMHDSESKQWQQMHANAIIFEAGNLQRTVHDAGIAIGGYCMTQNNLYGERSDRIIASVPERLSKLRALIKGSPRQEIAMSRLETVTQAGLNMLKVARMGIAESSKMQSIRRMKDLYSELKDTTNRMGEQIDIITAESHAAQEASTASWEQSKWAVRFFMFMALGINGVMAVALLSYFNSSIGRRLSTVAENASKALRNEQLPKPVIGTDEIASLDKAVHALALRFAVAPTSSPSSPPAAAPVASTASAAPASTVPQADGPEQAANETDESVVQADQNKHAKA